MKVEAVAERSHVRSERRGSALKENSWKERSASELSVNRGSRKSWHAGKRRNALVESRRNVRVGNVKRKSESRGSVRSVRAGKHFQPVD